MPPSSSRSAGATYLDKDRRIAQLRDTALRARARLPAIDRVILFGSLVRGVPTPRSDADILVILRSSEFEQPRDRVPAVLAAMSPLPCPVDLFVWTADELERAHREGAALVREAVENGLDLLT